MIMIDVILRKYVKKEQHREQIKGLLDRITKDTNIQEFILFEIFSNKDNALDMLKRKQFLFDHDIYSDIRLRIKEQEDFLEHPIQVEDGVIQCNRCKSHKTFSYSKQTRASDEGTTIFVRCSQCNHQFRL
jgi:DNA-directed RNA polymerase subunit M/transcription elongation factor TFIIS